MEQNKSHILTHNLTFGAYLGLVLVLHSVLGVVTGWDSNPAFPMIYLLLIVAGIWVSAYVFRRKNDMSFRFGSLFRLGFYTVAFSSVITALYNYVYVIYVPGAAEGFSKALLAEISKYPADQQKQLAEMIQSHLAGFYVSAYILNNIVFGAVFSLIVAAFGRKR